MIDFVFNVDFDVRALFNGKFNGKIEIYLLRCYGLTRFDLALDLE